MILCCLSPVLPPRNYLQTVAGGLKLAKQASALESPPRTGYPIRDAGKQLVSGLAVGT